MANPDHESAESSSDIAVVMVPLPAQDNVDQFFHFSRIISSSSYHHHNIPVHFVSTAFHNRQVKLRAAAAGYCGSEDPDHHPLLTLPNLHFHDSPWPPADVPVPDLKPYFEFSGCLPAQQTAPPLRKKVIALVRELAKTSSIRRVVVILDFLMYGLIRDVSYIQNTESYCFHTTSAFDLHYLVRTFKERPVLVNGQPIKEDLIPPLDRVFGPEALLDYFIEHLSAKKWDQGNIYNTSRAIEAQFLRLLAEDKVTDTDNHWAVGPFIDPVVDTDHQRKNSTKHLDWLQKQPPKSVIFISFDASSNNFPNIEPVIKEVALGLERSGQKFIWLLTRYADNRGVDDHNNSEGEDNNTTDQLIPEGFEERVEGRGIVILQSWAPQLEIEILRHPSTGGFLSHCVWRSCMDSISMGVPFATWPVHSDQALNAILITRVLKIGLPLRECTFQVDEVVRSEMVEEAVKRLMASPEGDEMRKRAQELSNAVKHSVSEDGDTAAERASFIAHITR